MTKRCLRVQIQGQVQGVGFRYHTCKQANEIGITGWVRNCPDGSVEACICGNGKQLDDMQQWLAHGPEWATVSDIHVESMAEPAELNVFKIT